MGTEKHFWEKKMTLKGIGEGALMEKQVTGKIYGYIRVEGRYDSFVTMSVWVVVLTALS